MRLQRRAYATDEVAAKAYSEVISFRQSFTFTEQTRFPMQWLKADRCQNLFPDRRLSSLFIDGRLPGTLAHHHQFPLVIHSSDYRTLF